MLLTSMAPSAIQNSRSEAKPQLKMLPDTSCSHLRPCLALLFFQSSRRLLPMLLSHLLRGTIIPHFYS